MGGSMGWIVGIIAVGAMILAAWMLLRTEGAPGRLAGSSSRRVDTGEIAELRRNLRAKTLGNDTLIDRLVQAERNKMPGASEAEYYRAAIDRWERDNR